MQWFHGRSHPLMDGEEIPQSLAEGTEFEQHLHRKTTAATAFIKAEARTMLRLALAARSRRIRDPEAGQIVYYYRRGKKRVESGYRGPARVIAVERHPERAVATIVWLAHGTTLVRAAPEHLRMATPLEYSVHDVVRGEASPPGVSRAGGGRLRITNRYLDLGRPPSSQERVDAEDIDVDAGDLHEM